MEHITIPEKLYGREKEISVLMESFERVSRGNAEVLLVPGHSGVGKTALVNELRKPVKAGNGFFITGKFEQYQQNVPYFAFRQALAELCKELQSEDEQQIIQFKTEILQALGTQAQVLIDLVPEFELFLGVQPPLGAIGPQEARHRFAEAMRNFLGVVCRPEHPLVLFIDDWQWAGIDSFELLKQLQVGKTLRYLLVVMAYRDNEINSGHSLLSTLDELQRNNVPIKELKVKNITQNSVVGILKDTLLPTIENASHLAEIIYNKTEGNPFFVKSLIIFLFDFKLLWFDDGLKCWKWKIDEEKDNNLPDNVVDLFIQKLHSINKDVSSLFSLAACLGNRFNIENLSIISGRSVSDCLKIFSSDQAKEMILPLPMGIPNSSKEDRTGFEIFMFQHDRLQQAAFSLIKEGDLPHILLKIGKLLLSKLSPEQINDRLFEIVNNLNAGFELIDNTNVRIQLVELNMKAARKAYTATAYSAALQYYTSANRVLELHGFLDYFWLHHSELGINFFKERAQCEFLEGDQKIGEKCIEEAVSHTEIAVKKADILNILIVHHTLHARYPEAIEAGKLALKTLGISLPEGDYENARDQEIALVRAMMKNLKVSSLEKLPVMSNPEMLMACKILITMGPPCYRSNQKLWSVIVPKVVGYTLSYGNIPQVGYSHTAFGGLLGWVNNDFSAAKEFSEAAAQLMTNVFRSPSDQSVFYLMIGSSIRHWFKHLKFGSQDYTDAYEIGLRSGNLQYAAYAFGHNMYCRFYQGVPLDVLITETKASMEFSLNRHNQWAIDLFEGGLKIFDALISDDADKISMNELDDHIYLQSVENNRNIQVTCIYKVLKTFSLLLAGNYRDALVLSDETEPIIYTVGTQGLLPWPEHVFARFLILTALFANENKKQQNIWREELNNVLVKLRIWADNCPENFEHKYLLAAAEMAKIDGRFTEAIQLYGKAADAAREGNFLQWEGMTNERTHVFWSECGNEHMAHIYWQHAYVCYSRWGVIAKVRLMEKLHKEYLFENLTQFTTSDAINEKEELHLKYLLVEKQIEQIRNYTFQMQQSKLRIEAIAQANELAQATQKLRSEIAVRKKTEEALRKSEEQFHSLFANMSEGVVLHELVYENGNPVNYRIVDVNHFYELIIGTSREQSIGKLATELYGVETPPYFKEYVEVAIEKIPFYFETYFAEMDKHFAISVAPWLDGGFATIFSDITDRKMADEEIKIINNDLEKLNREKDKFFSIIAHDLKSPFNNIMGLSELLIENIKGKDYNEIEKYGEMILFSSHKAVDLLMNLMEWSQTQSGRMIFNPNPLEIYSVIHDEILLHTETANQKSISISAIQNSPIRIFADKAMISTILRNLISNAIKFTKPGGDIVISADVNQNEVIIYVKDTGIGLNKTTIEKLFRIDVNHSTPGTQKEKGTGLGLILCKEFVEKHSGKIWVESNEGKGSTFFFAIPYSIEPEEISADVEVVIEDETKNKIQNLKILIVEDDEASETLLSIEVRKFSRVILKAKNGFEAVEICRNNPDIDLILMDIQMPVMNGYEATRQIRGFNKDLVIIAQTAFALTGDKEKAIDVGCNDYITKPIKTDELKQMIIKYLK